MARIKKWTSPQTGRIDVRYVREDYEVMVTL